MNFRTIKDLDACIVRNLYKVPRDIDLIVGIPRSGLLPATLVALYLNRPLTDVQGLLEGRLIRSGSYRQPPSHLDDLSRPRKVLLVDDSINTGTQMREAKAELEAAGSPHTVLTTAVYAAPRRSKECLDFYFEICPNPRLFEWNTMHRDGMTSFCVDMDGVLCEDPTWLQNDDGRRYAQFLREAKPRFIPSRRLGYIVTCRLEKYRGLTEEWLQAHGVQYDHLVMMDLPNKKARVRSGSHASFKAQVYRQTDTELFIESSRSQAEGIARFSGKPVLCMEGPEMVTSPIASQVGAAVATAAESPRAALRRLPWLLYRKGGRTVLHAWRRFA